jgi:hypothetical protein
MNRNSRKKAQNAQEKKKKKTHAKTQRRKGKAENRLFHRRSRRSQRPDEEKPEPQMNADYADNEGRRWKVKIES